MLERHEFEAFLTLAEELHFGRTAERLHLSTARISQTIRNLERRVGAPLFNRTSRRVELTAIGRQLDEELRPTWALIAAALERAIDAGRGITGLLRVGFVDAAGGQLLVGATEVFRDRHPDCDVQIREARMSDVVRWLREAEVDVVLAGFPARDPGIAMGPVLVREARFLALPAGHRLARQASVSVEDMARIRILHVAGGVPDSWRDAHTPDTTPAGRPIEPGPSATTFQEALTLVGAGQGAFPVGAHARRYHARPDVTYLPFQDAPPMEWGLLWRADAETARVRAFSQAAFHLTHSNR
ncbi:LysR family transcriptional regulator [Streptomyces sp. NPDC050619]|uniref:LysR family transcriptional regulator n=1 Tax=Streptomyces sp. NPDC050619 TaxID=3157214 RepID=UPI0034375FD3